MNWPNGLSVARLIMGPIVLVCLLTGFVRLAFYIFVVAMLTDLCDGYLARRSNRVTEFGKLMDPLADKVLVSLVLIGLLFMGLPFVSLWMVAVIIARELLILGCRTGVFKSGEGFVTSRAAKWKTAAQMVWISGTLLYLTVISRVGLSPGDPQCQAIERGLWGVGVVAVALTIISGADYLVWSRDSGGNVPQVHRNEEV
ncbi:MAG: CDP-diacylglycerol--glycerol-3-phosphate 3-phosphatidyltransferase [Candidatus Eisenbacteria bacterium]